MPVEFIAGAVEAIAKLVDTVIQHVDKDPETRRLLKIQAVDEKLYDISEKIDSLMTQISLEGEK